MALFSDFMGFWKNISWGQKYLLEQGFNFGHVLESPGKLLITTDT